MGRIPDTGATLGSDSSCSDSAAANTSAGGEASPQPHVASLTGRGVGGSQVAEELSLFGVARVSRVPPIYLTANSVAFRILFNKGKGGIGTQIE